jgi:AraC-like DNA-binding protein
VGVGFAAGQFSHFHVIERGRCWLRLQGKADATALEPGDLLLVTPGHGYQLSDEPTTPPIPVRELVGDSRGGLYAVLRHGGGGRAARMICGAFEFGSPQATSFLTMLPEWIRVQKHERSGNQWLDATVGFLAREIERPDVGAATIITSLIDVLFVEAIRTWLRKQPPGTAGWLGALRDPSIGAALGLIHQSPEKRWTVPALSAAVGLSRSPFAAKFRALVGQSPMAYLKRWRLQVGATYSVNRRWLSRVSRNESGISPRPHSAGRSPANSVSDQASIDIAPQSVKRHVETPKRLIRCTVVL